MNYSQKELKDMSNAVRFLSADAVQRANSGHPGMPMGMAEVATVLFAKFLKYDPAAPGWYDRDRFVLSAGHGSMLLYSLLHLTGYEDFGLAELKNFRQLHSATAGHPEFGHGRGIETTTGPLGQGLANAVGMALAEKVLAEKFGKNLFNHHTYVLAGDGCLMEGVSQEAVSFAGNLCLDKLILLFDDNSITIDGSTELATRENQADRFKACGWNELHCDGHDFQQIESALLAARNSERPTIILCKTKIGKGSPKHAGKASAHGSPLGPEDLEATRATLEWEHPPFEVPDSIYELWHGASIPHRKARETWQREFEASAMKDELDRVMNGELKRGWSKPLETLKARAVEEKIKQATRKSGQQALEILVRELPELLGGSADLTGSNLTRTKSQSPVSAESFSGGYVHYGVREHGMAAVMNGVSLHGGLIPYGGTFLVFTDYCRPAIRLSALMKRRVIYVMTHDSIGLGEDGPTHQPVEHLCALRSMPNLLVFRPCDLVETAEAWEAALSNADRPSVIALSRQSLPASRNRISQENLSLKGAYVIRDAEVPKPDVTLFATGSEVAVALEASEKLGKRGVRCRIVSAPCLELFAEQSPEYKNRLLKNDSLKVAVEAGVGDGWYRWIGNDGMFFGMESFGASGKAEELFEHFKITADHVADSVAAKLSGRNSRG